jgi:hypothetical protein
MSPKKPILLLIRRVIDEQSVWLLHSQHDDAGQAERTWRRHIKGQGVTAWSWWGPRRIAEKMLADPSYDPDSEAVMTLPAALEEGR